MSRGGIKISRTDEFESSQKNVPNWLKQFANSYDEKTAVEVARNRNKASEPSIYDRMNSIMNGTKVSPYATVDDAVRDYQERTGLLKYQQRETSNKIAQSAQEIMKSADDEEEKKNSSAKPKLLDENPAIDNYINNVVDTQYGIQMPAVLQGILEMFSRHVSESDLDDADLARHIVCLINSKRKPTDMGAANIGRGVGTERATYEPNDSNRDPFAGLMPKRVY
jgi:hypothetical protein